MTTSSRACVAAVALSVLVTVTPSAAPQAAQRVTKCGPNEVVPWWPRVEFNLGAENLSAAERTTVQTRLAAVEALMRKTNYSAARGFAVWPVFGYHAIGSR